MSRLARWSLVLALAAVAVACGRVGDDTSAGETVCRAVDREIVVDERLMPDVPSSTFVVEADDDVWVGLIADADVSGSAVLSRVTGLYLIDEAAPVEYTRDDLGGVETEAPYLDFDEEGQFVRLEVAPATYRLWSVKSPEVQVIRCIQNGGGGRESNPPDGDRPSQPL